MAAPWIADDWLWAVIEPLLPVRVPGTPGPARMDDRRAGPLRVGVGPDGKVRRTISVPGTGIYDTEIIGRANKPANPTDRPSSDVQPPPPPPVGSRQIEPLVLEHPITAKGHTVTFDGWWIDIQRTGITARLAAKVNSFDSTRIPLDRLVRVEWKQPSMLVNGHLRFVVADEEPSAHGSVVAAADPKTVLVTKQQVERFERLRAALSEALGSDRTPHPSDTANPARTDIDDTDLPPGDCAVATPPAAPPGWYPDPLFPALCAGGTGRVGPHTLPRNADIAARDSSPRRRLGAATTSSTRTLEVSK
ncbi:DUF4429 domain-containing protein [Nocardia noduli]|uniref:DUF4429 domain-containing protein n=1 Tax=Nocardia noduli TaxID=2815722 RepID=UPI001C2159BF|nr:DUF4429 domain-containing protein [Nocardia noduli]